jgi:Putative beta barrel porin-7 (BBP7)
MRPALHAAAITLFVSAVFPASAIAQRADAPNTLPSVPGHAMMGTPVLLPTNPDCACEPKNDCNLTGGSTGLRPGVDCLPEPGGDICCNRPRLYGSVEYYLQWFENQRVPPLVAIAPPNSMFGNPAGVPGEIVLFGGRKVDFGGIDGMRATAGYWLDAQQNRGVEASGFLTEQTGKLFAVLHDGAATNPVLLARTSSTGALAATVGFPGLVTGSVIASQHTRLWGSEANGVLNWSDSCRSRIDLLAGFRYLDLDESLDIQDTSQAVFAPTFVQTRTDSFDARTQFWGGQIGARTTIGWGCASLCLIGKVGLGVSHLSVDREGQTFVPAGLITTLPAGLLVTPDNTGRDTTDRFAVLTETTIQVGYQWTKCLQTTVGYTLLYLTSSARVGDQIQRTGGINATDFYSNGITFGIGLRY